MNKVLLFLLVLLLSVTLSAQTMPDLEMLKEIDTSDDDFTVWLALFGLALIGILALFLSSEKINTFKKQKKKDDKIQEQMQKEEDAIITQMEQNINGLTNTNLSQSNMVKSENQLLAITKNLIDFLRTKSKKVIIEHQKLKLSNLLNDVSGTLSTNIKGKELELIYDIDPNVSQSIDSDTLTISKVLVNVLLYCVDNDSTSIDLKVARTSLFAKNDQLSFIINSNLQIEIDNKSDLFLSNYNDKTEEYDSLGLFIAKEFATLMKGDLIARNNSDSNLEFVFSVPYSKNISESESKSESKSKKSSIKEKNILLIDSYDKSANSIANILISLGHKVKIVNKNEYLTYLEYLNIYDLILLDEQLFTNKAVSIIKAHNIKVVSIANLFNVNSEFPNSDIPDMKISKPLTKWQISDMLNKLYVDIHDASRITKDGVINTGTAPIHRNTFQNTRNISLSSFLKFRDRKILLVEDNLINQKVFSGVLGKSNIDISIANHGKEALSILTKDKEFDIIFMDINMPVMDGYAASINIRENPLYDNIPIVALSALTSSDEVEKMFASGMNGYMSKPLEKEKLYTVFSLYIENTKQFTEAALESETDRPASLDGLNVNLGIKKSSSSEIFYKEILIEFKDAYGDTDVLIEKLLNDFRYEQLRILCMDLKGLSGTIGAKKLNSIITQILQKISFKQYDFIPELVQQYTLELKTVNKSINEYLA